MDFFVYKPRELRAVVVGGHILIFPLGLWRAFFGDGLFFSVSEKKWRADLSYGDFSCFIDGLWRAQEIVRHFLMVFMRI